MSDFKRIVEIAVKVTGDASRQIEDVAKRLGFIGKAASSLSDSTNRASSGVAKLSNSLKQLDSFTPPVLTQFVKDINSLAKIDASALKTVASAIKDLSKIKFSSSFDNIPAKLSAISNAGDPSKITALVNALSSFGSVAKLPNLTSFITNLGELSKIGKLPSLSGLGTQLTTIATVSKLPAIGSFVNNLALLSKLPKIQNLDLFAKALTSFSSVGTLPDLSKFVSGLSAISSVPKPASFASLATALKRLEGIKVDKMPDPKMLASIAKSITAFSQIGKISSIGTFVTSLKKLQDIGKIKAPDYSKLIAEVNRLSAAFTKLSNAAPFITALAQMGQQAAQLQTQMNGLGGASHHASSGIEKFLSKIKSYVEYRIIADSIMQLKEAFMAGQEAIIEYDQSLKDLQAISGATDTEVVAMGEAIREVASTTKFSASEVAEGMVILAQAGLSASESTNTIAAAANLATGTLETMSQTVDLLTTVMSIFNVEASRSSEIADLMANAINKSKLTVEKLRTAINYVGPIAEEAGISVQEMSAAMMTLANSGLRASTIGTSLRSIIGELVDPSEKMTKAVSKAGLSLRELDPRVNSLSDVIKKLSVVIHGSDDAIDIFGKRASSAVLTLANTTRGGFDEMLGAVSRTGTASEMARKQMEGLGVSIKNLGDKLGLLAISMGASGFTGALKATVDVLRSFVDVLISVSDSALFPITVKVAAVTASLYGVHRVLLLLIPLFGKFNVAIRSAYLLQLGAAATTASTSLRTLGIVTVIQGYFVNLAKSVGLATLSMSLFSKVLKFTGIGLIVAAVSAIAMQFEFLNGSIKKSAETAGALAEKFSALKSGMSSYSTRIKEAGDSITAVSEINKELRVELVKVASNSREFGVELSSAAFNAMNSIGSLTNKVTDGGKAIEEYQEAILRLESIKLADYFNKQQESINQNSRDAWGKWATNATNSLSFVGKMFSATVDSVSMSKHDREAFAKNLTDMFAEGAIKWEQYEKDIEKIRSNVNLGKSETRAVETYNAELDLAKEVITKLAEHNVSMAQITAAKLKGIKENSEFSFIPEVDSALFDAIIAEAKRAQQGIKDSSTSIVDEWKEAGNNIKDDFISSMIKVGDSASSIAPEVAKDIQNIVGNIDLSGLDKVAEKRAVILREYADLEKMANDTSVEGQRLYVAKKFEIDQKYAKLRTEEAKDTNTVIATETKAALDTYLKQMQEYLDKNGEQSDGYAEARFAMLQQLFSNLMGTVQAATVSSLPGVEASITAAADKSKRQRLQNEVEIANFRLEASKKAGDSANTVANLTAGKSISLLKAEVEDAKAIIVDLNKAIPADGSDDTAKIAKLRTDAEELILKNTAEISNIQADMNIRQRSINKENATASNNTLKAKEEELKLQQALERSTKRVAHEKNIANLDKESIGVETKGYDKITEATKLAEINAKAHVENIRFAKEEAASADNLVTQLREQVRLAEAASGGEEYAVRKKALIEATNAATMSHIAVVKEESAAEQQAFVDRQKIASVTLEETDYMWRRGGASVEEYQAAVQEALDSNVITKKEADRAMIESGDDLSAAMQLGWTDWLATLQTDTEFAASMVSQTMDAVVSGLTTAFMAMVSGSKTAKEAFLEMGRSIVNMLLEMITKQLLYKAIATVGSAIGGAAEGGPIQKLAGGGGVRGWSPNPKADNVPIWATAGEFMHPVAAVKKYGLGFMEAIRTLSFPTDIARSIITGGLSTSPSSFALAGGGSVPDRQPPIVNTGDIKLRVVNVLDKGLVTDYMNTVEGVTTLINTIRRNGSSIRTILGA